MKIIKTPLRHDFSRDTYWGRLKFISEKDAKTSLVMICASYEYFDENLKSLDEKKINAWYDTVVSEWKDKGNSLFKSNLHYDIRATTQEGFKNGEIFLTQKV